MKFRIIIRLITGLLIVFLLILMVFGFGYSLMEVKSVVKLSYRQNLKTTNPEKYEEYLIKQKERNKAYRRKLKSIQSKKFKTPEEKDKLEKYRTSACLRQQKFRKKLQLDGDIRPTKKNDNENQLLQPTKKKVNTRLEIKQQRESWRLSKSLWRSKLSGAKKRWIKEKDKQRKRKKRKDDRIDDKKLCTPPQSVSKLNQRTLYNVASTVRKKLPKSPDKFAEVLHHIEKTLTPNKKQALTTLRGSDDKSREILFKIKLRLKKRSINIKRKQRKDTLSITTKKKVNDFYFNNSRPLPNKRYATKYGPGFVFQLTLRNGYTQFRKENPKLAICFSKFASLRPKNVRLLSKSDWQYCVCTVCQNIRYKLQTLNSLSNLKIKSDLYLYDIIDVFLCSKPGTKKYHKHECVYGKCSKCNNYKKTIEAFYKDLLSNDTQSRNPVTWHHWERVVEKDEKIRKNLLTKSGPLKEMLDEFFVDLSRPVQGSSFFKHHFQGNWQQSQFLTLKSNLPEDTALLVLDFGKNRNIHHQDQAKSDFFAAKQVTIHPIVVFYKSRTIPELTVRESIIFVTDDLKHDVDAVQLFLNEALRHVKSIGEVRKVVIFSDGCTAQYKGSRALEALSRRKDMIEWNFFGSDHGKSEADGEMGNLNRALDLAVIGRQVIIRNSADIVDWGNKNLKLDEAGSKRHFKYISTDMISGIRDENQDKIITIKGIRNYHQVRNLQKDNEILVRSLSCYCKKCCDMLNSECLNADYVEEFTKKIISKSTKDPSPESFEAASYNFNKYFKTFNDFSDYNSLKEFVDYNWSHVPVLPEGNTDPTFLSTKKQVDRNSISLIPEDLEDKGLFPAVIYGDGNCLPRCGSVLAYGFEDKFNEMRQRIVMDLVINEQEYLKNDNSKTYSMFSEFYRGQKLTKLGIQDIYRTETLDVCKNGSFMGVWQLMALANILKRPIHSVYPSYGGKTVQKDLNKIFYPLTQSTVPPAYILWTNTEGDDISEKNWMPNHFVVLLRTNCDVLSPHHDLDSSTSGFDMSDIEELVDSEVEVVDSEVEELAKDIPAEENIQMRSE